MPRRASSRPVCRQAAALALRPGGRSLEVLLVTSSGGGRWVLPKGHVEPGERAWASAQREALEEAGLVGRVARTPLGSYRTSKRGLEREVEVFVLEVSEVLDRWIERRLRRRRWMPLERAIERVREPALKALLGRLGEEHARSTRRRTA